MNPWKVDMTIKWEQEQYLEDGEYPWILENPKITLTKMGNQSVSTVTYIDT